MSDKPVILFLCNEPNYDIYNRRSAIDSILKSILDQISNNYLIYVNGDEFKPTFVSEKGNVFKQNPIKKAIVRCIPLFIRERIKMRRILNNSDGVVESLNNFTVKPDIIIELYKLGSNCGKRLQERFNCPLLIYYDSPVVEQYEDIWKIKAPFRSELIRRQKESISAASAVLAYSRPVGALLQKYGATKLHYYATLDYSRLDPIDIVKDDALTIGFIGSFMPWHRVDMLVHVFERLRGNNPANMKLLLVGAGECFESVQKQVSISVYKDDIEMTGFVDGEALKALKSRIDIGVMPGSNWYGIPTKVFEYGACGIASVAPDTPTISDIFSVDELAMFKWDDEHELELVIGKLIKDQTLRQQLGQNLKKRIDKDYNINNADRIYNDLIKELISNG